MNPETKEFYSSKPPLIATMLAGEYWLLKRAFGWDIVRDRWLVIPAILLTVNVIPFAVYLVLLARLIEATGKTDFGKLLAFTTARRRHVPHHVLRHAEQPLAGRVLRAVRGLPARAGDPARAAT